MSIQPHRPSVTGKRIFATLLDYSLIMVCTFTYVMVYGEPNDQGGKTISGIAAFIPMLAWFFYFVLSETIFQTTLGHHIMELKVISTDGQPIGFSQALKRRLYDILEISWCCGLIAFLIVKNTAHAQRLGDLLAHTLVIGKKESFQPVEFDFEKEAKAAP